MKAFLCFAFLAMLAVAWAAASAEEPAAAADSRDKRGLLNGDLGYGAVLPSYGYNGYYGRSYGYGLPAYGYNYGALNNINRYAPNTFW